MTATPTTIAAALSASRARRLHGMELGFGRAAAIWSNSEDRVAYERPQGHTLSLYLQGGEGTRRLGRQAAQGHPGAICILPQAQSSEWEITARFAFVHLYLPDAELRRSFAEIFDRDARLMALPELAFGDLPGLAAPLRRLAAALCGQDALAAEAAMHEAIAAALSPALAPALLPGLRPSALKGGLAPHLRRRILERIEAELDTPLRLEALAAMAGLSPFHFQRVFQASQGVSPQGWVLRRRLERARRLLGGDTPVARIAASCGFSSQSHLTRAFRAASGTTPAAYRAALRGGGAPPPR
ncbi:helix-turn-helix domain-containing protein [Pseudoroseomonas cervicalis]|uniref:helix-turn-helix domain-containing protein n=1 Tax=Teichococcus cervicalis TaxID=204525 RepID=UPI00277F2864|nr:AraC family transcriptional regulator [Pseudoroseomonas cervicalis]MDQ1077892.1 AraC family transcriptional regulator [Pseudoroseomonas cervicalis]